MQYNNARIVNVRNTKQSVGLKVGGFCPTTSYNVKYMYEKTLKQNQKGHKGNVKKLSKIGK